jgi:hypothetical protein
MAPSEPVTNSCRVQLERIDAGIKFNLPDSRATGQGPAGWRAAHGGQAPVRHRQTGTR